MKYLLVGLGNIGSQYARTRHNIGFMVADHFADKLGVKFDTGRYAFVAQARFKSAQFIIIKPTTYMNLSGKAVAHWLNSEKIPLENLLVIVDELALPFGTLRLRGQGSSGGHNGLKDIELALATQAYPRLRIGIGSDFSKGKQIDYVLGEFTEEEKAELPTLFERCAEIIKSFALEGIAKTMTLYNK